MEATIALEREHTEWREAVFGVNPHRTLLRVLVWGIGCVTCFHHMLLPIRIVGSSMYPTYNDGALNMINKMTYHASTPQKGDVIALRWEGELLLKRIVATPGDLVTIHNGRMRVNGELLDDDFGDLSIW